jgi:hypothetical protein
MADSAGNEPGSFNENLGRLADELWQVAERVHAHTGAWAAGAGVDDVHSIVTSAAHALRAIAGWYEHCREDIFDDRVGAEQDAGRVLEHAERSLRAFAAELVDVAERHNALVHDVDSLRHRDLYALTDSELGEHETYYAVLDVMPGDGRAIRFGAYTRYDVARYHARRYARASSPDDVYRVDAVTADGASRPLAQWSGEHDPGDLDA